MACHTSMGVKPKDRKMKIHPKGNLFFLGAAFSWLLSFQFGSYRGSQLATKMAPAFLGLAGALITITITSTFGNFQSITITGKSGYYILQLHITYYYITPSLIQGA